MAVQDIKLGTDGDLYFDPINPDLVLAPSDMQHITDIIQSVPGHYKEFPLIGFNPYQYLNGKTNPQVINQALKIQLQADGYTIGSGGVNVVVNPDGKIEIKALDVTRG